MYPQSVLDNIRERLSIVAVISERVPLKKAGRNYRGLCPFHSEKTPSFMVNDEKQIYHCFGCGEGGNIFSFVMKFDHLSFPEAIESLASRAGVILPKNQENSTKEDALEQRKKWAYRLNQIVAEHFQKNLTDSKKGETARNYLKSRGFFNEKNTQHFLGYAEDSWDGLVDFLKAKKVPMDLAVELGLVKKGEKRYYDFFRHRIMFSVISPRGRVVAFSGRTFGSPKTSEGREDPAKYLNSPDSLIYHKSHTVFGLSVAQEDIRKEDFVIVVEGNLDVLRLHEFGIKNVVAPLGTALTSGHLRLLSRYTKEFVVIFDGDEAGRKAFVRSLPLFLEASLVPRAVALPNGEDPDSFVSKNGAEALLRLIESAPTLFELVIDDTVARCGASTNGRVKTVDELRPLFEMLKNPVELATYRRRLASLLMLDEAAVTMALAGKSAKVVNNTVHYKNSIEQTLLEIMLSYPETIKTVKEAVDIDCFTDEAKKTIAKMIFENPNIGGLTDQIADSELKREILSYAMSDEKYDDPMCAAIDCARNLKKRSARQRLNSLQLVIQNLKGDDIKIKECMNEIQSITKDIHGL